jgi:monoamine oxidase
LDTALLYRAGSAVVHTNPSALLGFTMSDEAPSSNRRPGLRKALNATIAARMCQTGIEVYSRAFWSCARYLGERTDDLAALLDSLASDLAMPVERHFWKR